MQDPAQIEMALVGARPKAVAALLRYFRDLDTAEEAFQEACLRALQNWPRQGPPREPAAWLIMVGRNATLDARRRRRGDQPLIEEDLPPQEDEVPLAERLDASEYRDDILRLMFVCSHPSLSATQQVALALRIVAGLSVPQIAGAFLVSSTAMEQRITRAKRAIAAAGIEFETPGPVERTQRLHAVSATIYLIFNEGYASTPDTAEVRAPLAAEAIRLARLLSELFQSEPEVLGLLSLLLLQHSRARARFDAQGELILLDAQDRALWDRSLIGEGLSLLERASRQQDPGPYQLQAAIAAVHASAASAQETSWASIDSLYQSLERIAPSPVVTLNRAVAVSKLRGPAEALEMIEPLGDKLSGYFYYHGLRGALLKQLKQPEAAREALNRAIALAGSLAESRHIRQQLDSLLAPAS